MVEKHTERAWVVFEHVERPGILHAGGIDERAVRAGDGDGELMCSEARCSES